MRYTFSENLKKIRLSKGMTQRELADKIGVAQNTLSAWETNERYPSLDRLYDISKALDIQINSLIK